MMGVIDFGAVKEYCAENWLPLLIGFLAGVLIKFILIALLVGAVGWVLYLYINRKSQSEVAE